MLRVPLLIVVSLAVLGCKPDSVEPTPPSIAPLLIEQEQTGPRFIDAYVDSNHGCAVERGGKLWCWGIDPAMRIGMREQSDRWELAGVVRDLEPAVAVAGDLGTTCILLADGRVRCWQIPTRSRPDGLSSEFVPTLDDAVAIAIDNTYLCVRRRGGEVECSTIRGGERRQVSSGAIDFAFNGRRMCSLDDEGGVWCWDSFAQELILDAPTAGRTLEIGPAGELLMAKIPGAVEIDVGDSNGDVVVRGPKGEILIEPPVGFDDPLPVTEYRRVEGVADASAMVWGEGHGCAVSQGLVRCFGGNGWAQLGDGSSGKREQPVLVAGITEAHAVAASRSLSCALHGDGVSCWGTRATAGNDMNPLERHIALRDATSVVLDEGGTCATRSSGENVCWGTTTRIAPFENDVAGVFASHEPKPLPFALGRLRARDMPCYLDELGLLVCGQMLDDDAERQATVSTQFDEYERHTGVLGFGLVGGLCRLEAKQVLCLDDDQRPRELPKLIKPTAIAGGDEAVCVIHDGGKLGCFAPTLVDGVPRTTELLAIPEFVDIVQLLAIDSCFGTVDRKGDVRTFCLSLANGALEVGAVKPWPLTEIVEMIIHPDGLCGLTRSKEFACLNYQTQAVTREFSDVVDIAGNWQHTCVLQGDGVLTCMGDNRFGQLGAMPQTVMAKPVAIEFPS